MKEVSVSTRQQIDERMHEFAQIPGVSRGVDAFHETRFRAIYAQTQVLYTILTKEWDCPSDLKKVLFSKTPPLTVAHVTDDFAKCFLGFTRFAGEHIRNISHEDVLRFLQSSQFLLREYADRAAYHRRMGGVVWSNGCCFALRDSQPPTLYLPIDYHVFHPFYFSSQSATPFQAYQSSRIAGSNAALYTTPLYSALIEGLSFLMRVTKFYDDPFQHDVRPVFFRPRFFLLVDSSPTHGRSLFAVVRGTPPQPVVEEGVALTMAAGVVRPSFASGESYAFDYFPICKASWCKDSNLVVTTEASLPGGVKVEVGSPIFFANCSHQGNCYVYTVEIKGKGVVEGSDSLYKMPVLTAARDFYLSDFERGESVAVSAGYPPIKGMMRLPLEYNYSPKHSVPPSKKFPPGFQPCRCLSHCFGRKEKWGFFVDPKEKEVSTVEYDLSYIKKMTAPPKAKESMAKWMRMAQGK